VLLLKGEGKQRGTLRAQELGTRHATQARSLAAKPARVEIEQARGKLSVCSGTAEWVADRLSGTRGEQMRGSKPAQAAREGGRETRMQRSRAYHRGDGKSEQTGHQHTVEGKRRASRPMG
jgi:hypothetical protein